MATVKFDHRVKYKKQWHPAHTTFQVDEGDVPALKALGAQVLSREKPATPPAEEPGQGSTPPAGENHESNGDSGENEGSQQGEQEGDGDKGGEDRNAALKEELLSYNLEKLTAFAKERGIDLKGKTRKADVYNVIIAAL